MAELEAQKLQARAAKLDESIPKPDPKRAAALEDEIDRRTDARKRRQDADLPNDEVVKQATPKPIDLPKPDATDAIEPRTAFGKWWQKVKDGVERAKVRFNEWLEEFGDRLVASSKIPAHGMPAGATIVEPLGKDYERAEKHANMYYEEIRKKKNDVEKISENTGISVNEIRRIKRFLFLDEHDLEENGIRRFYPNFMIAQSWQRLESGKNIQPHDLTLLRHELEERRLMVDEGLSQSEAHWRACKKFDYPREAEAYYDSLKKHKEAGRMD